MKSESEIAREVLNKLAEPGLCYHLKLNSQVSILNELNLPHKKEMHGLGPKEIKIFVTSRQLEAMSRVIFGKNSAPQKITSILGFPIFLK